VSYLGRKIAVLMGGMSAERQVSLETGRAIAGALRQLGHDVWEVDAGRETAARLAEIDPEVAFLALHGRGGEDGTMQGLLEVMRIPYTGCGVLASAVTMDKVVTKEILAFHGIPLVEDLVVQPGYDPKHVAAQVAATVSFPVMVKPPNEGSSIGVIKVDKPEDLLAALDEVFSRDSSALIERFVKGRLLTVGILGKDSRVLPVLEITVPEGFYDYQAKYQPGISEYQVPALISPELSEKASSMSLETFNVLGCEGISRIDLMLEDGTERIMVLEVNTIPGMTAQSLVPMAAAAIGMTFNEVVAEILNSARLKVDLVEKENTQEK
jgi:D-alanine-D-alanine ligase